MDFLTNDPAEELKNALTKSHLIGENNTPIIQPWKSQKIEAFQLVGMQFSYEKRKNINSESTLVKK